MLNYLVFGIAIIIFALAPVIRFTYLGLRQVSKGVKDAGKALGCSKLVILYKIELPLAIRSILAGVNQTLMLSLSMAVIAALIGAGGLGCPIIDYLSRAGVGKIGIIDFDKVDVSNIHRQSIYTLRDVGKYKVEVLKKKITDINQCL